MSVPFCDKLMQQLHPIPPPPPPLPKLGDKLYVQTEKMRCNFSNYRAAFGHTNFFFQLKGAGNSLLGWKLKPRKNFQIVHLRLDWDWHRLKPKPMSFSINSHFKMSKFTALEQIFIDWYQKNKKVFPFIFHFQFRSNSNLPLPVCSFQLHFCCLKMCNVSLLFISFSVTFNLLNYHTHF